MQTAIDTLTRGISSSDDQATDPPYSIDGFMAIYLLVAIFVISMDYVNLGKYYFQSILNILGSKATAYFLGFFFLLVIIGCIHILVRTYKQVFVNFWHYIHFQKLNLTDWFFLLLILFFTLIRIAIPDRSWDTVSYHLLIQHPNFEDNISWNFFPSSFLTFLFPLGDHIFFLFRQGLGYRAGTFLNSLIIVVLYFQIRDYFFGTSASWQMPRNKQYTLPLMAMFVVSTEFIFANVGIYKIDLLALPFVFEILRSVIQKNVEPNFAVIYSSLMIGIATAIKLSTIVFWAPLFIIISIRYIRKIHFSAFFLSGLSIAFPLTAYLVYNFAQTGNPVYPWFNNVFHSPYFSPTFYVISEGDPKGPKNMMEALFWPLYIFFRPEKTAQTAVAFYSGRITIGWIVGVALIYFGIVEKKTGLILLPIYNFVSIFLWTSAAGFIRYGLFAEIVSGMIIVQLAFCLIEKGWQVHTTIVNRPLGLITVANVPNLILRGVFILLITCSFLQIGYAYYWSFSNKVDWSQRPNILNQKSHATYLNNLKLLGKDHAPFQSQSNSASALTDVDVWVVLDSDHNAGYAKILKGSIPIINLNFEKEHATYDTNYKPLSSTIFRSNNKYLLSSRPAAEVADELMEYGYRIVDIRRITPSFITRGSSLQLIKISR